MPALPGLDIALFSAVEKFANRCIAGIARVQYVISCQQCEFRADATRIASLGALLNLHASGCLHDPLVALLQENDSQTPRVAVYVPSR